MNILEKIIARKREEVEEAKVLVPVKKLEQSVYFPTETISMKKYIQRDDKSGIIAEVKRKSPSKGIINAFSSVEEVSIGYMQAGASALSVLTDVDFFGGKNENLTIARKFNFCPILRKDFIIDEYQIIEAKSIGADAILLIAACLEPNRLTELAKFAHSLGLEVLMEVHNKEELDRSLSEHLDLVGVNNRDLTTFTTSLDVSKKLAEFIPDQFVKVSESGLNDPAAVVDLKKYGYEGFLIGEYFMKHANPGKACAEFVEQIQRLEK
ncbi:indole-3-glycerol phosphate synthase TrpC [Aureibacter tunicatorum]|uniref:Indole-3-glycerol phosphate synthase n=1 Tax=Aureibacter tunicatorum TaxID=866807 RepID=A0AAE3XK06_9BACT|nr:indole-3-glycerol phosphate synthase TrpC [Aureibacter tunicatorum]MDR6239196.1 indole-3-glycerol phosphate synthase [Aureibacter tunicatorum]BDD04878.1 indole-3-glycerol phosphate synthase [Aureibacter tunicatorum]